MIKDYCTDCGWNRLITQEFMTGRKEIKLCAECEMARKKASIPKIPKV